MKKSNQSNLLWLLVKGLATWRLSYMLVNEDGPNYAFQKLRVSTGIEYSDFNEIVSRNSWTPLYCMYCTSIWVALAFGLLPNWIAKPFAVSAIAIGLDKIHGYSKN